MSHGRTFYRCGCLRVQCRCPGPHVDTVLPIACPKHQTPTFGAGFLASHYGPDRVAERAEAFLRGAGPAPALDPVQFFGALGFDPEVIPEAVEQIRRDRERLLPEVWD